MRCTTCCDTHLVKRIPPGCQARDKNPGFSRVGAAIRLTVGVPQPKRDGLACTRCELTILKEIILPMTLLSPLRCSARLESQGDHPPDDPLEILAWLSTPLAVSRRPAPPCAASRSTSSSPRRKTSFSSARRRSPITRTSSKSASTSTCSRRSSCTRNT